MKVRQLREILSEMPEDALVVLAQDAVGNGFSPVGSYNTDMEYLPDRQPWRRGRIFEEMQPEFSSQHAKAALVLWPLH